MLKACWIDSIGHECSSPAESSRSCNCFCKALPCSCFNNNRCRASHVESGASASSTDTAQSAWSLHLPSLQTIETKSQSFCHAQSAACLLSVLKFLIVEPSDFLQCSKFKWGQSQPKNHSSKLSPVGLATNSAGHRGNLTACCKPLQCLLSNTSSHQLL